LSLASLIGLSGCSQADASVPDVSNDIHCSVIIYHFGGHAEQSGAPAEQKRAMAVLNEWYRAKVRQLPADRWESNSLMKETAPILETVMRDPQAMLDELKACSDRATTDPAFDRFVRTLG
jgi:hypothetical protein